MRFLICAMMIPAALAVADQAPAPAPPPPAKPPAAVTKPARKGIPLTVPPDAIEVSPGLYRWAGKDNKVWMYRKTPFGVSRWVDDHDDSKLRVVTQETRVTDLGDSVRFERPTPFGSQIWVRKKADMDETERLIFERQQHKTTPTKQSEKE